MLIKMKKTTPVSTTGLNNLTWIKGEIYDASKDLARNLVKGGLAIIKKDTTSPKPVEAPAITPLPEGEEGGKEPT